MRASRWVAALSCCVAAFFSGGAGACAVSSSGVNFGQIGLLDAPVDSVGEIFLDCPAGTPFTVELDNGALGAAPDARKMSSGTDTITYGLYKDGARSSPWGTGSDARSGTGAGAQQILTVYGRLPSQVAPTPGTYSDTITVIVTY